MKYELDFARAYNSATGSNITHTDTRNFGIMEKTLIIEALNLRG